MYKCIIYRLIPRTPEDRTRMPIAGFGIDRYRPRFGQTRYIPLHALRLRAMSHSRVHYYIILYFIIICTSYLGGVYTRYSVYVIIYYNRIPGILLFTVNTSRQFFSSLHRFTLAPP